MENENIIIEFLDLIQEKGIEEEVIFTEEINDDQKFIEFIEENLNTEDIKEISFFLYKNRIKINDVFEYINEKFSKHSNDNYIFTEDEEIPIFEEKDNSNNKLPLNEILMKLNEISEKIEKLEKYKEVQLKENFSALNEEIENTKKFLKDLRIEVNNEVKVYSQSVLTTVEDNFKKLSDIITNLAEKFITLKAVLNNEYELSKISNKKNSSEVSSNSSSLKSLKIFIIPIALLLAGMYIWKIF